MADGARRGACASSAASARRGWLSSSAGRRARWPHSARPGLQWRACWHRNSACASRSLPWHTDRLRILQLAASLAGACAALGKIARDVTLLAQTEIAEVAEGVDDPRQGGSSAMPHKRNPVASVVILGCTRRAPGLLATLAAAAEHELQRAAGAWHAEWEPLDRSAAADRIGCVVGGAAADRPACRR